VLMAGFGLEDQNAGMTVILTRRPFRWEGLVYLTSRWMRGFVVKLMWGANDCVFLV
jgi:hypothetical protein